MSIAIGLLLTAAPNASAQSVPTGDDAHGPERSPAADKPSEFILQFDKNGDCRVTQDEMKGASTDQKPTNGRGKKF
jgi:hypothetical protein